MKKKRLNILLILIILLYPTHIFAETILLKSGKLIQGKILEKTDKYIKIDFQGVSLTYYLDEIESIDGIKPVLSTIEENKLPQYKENDYSLSSESAEGFVIKGKEYYIQDNFDESISCFTKAIELDPNYTEAYFGRGTTYKSKRDYDQAIIDFTKAIELDPSYAKAYAGRGVADESKGNYDQAIIDFTKAMELNFNRDIVYFGRGIAYMLKGNYDQAIIDFTKAIDLNPNHAESYYARGKAYFLKKCYDEAWVDVHKAEELGFKVPLSFVEKLKEESGREN